MDTWSQPRPVVREAWLLAGAAASLADNEGKRKETEDTVQRTDLIRNPSRLLQVQHRCGAGYRDAAGSVPQTAARLRPRRSAREGQWAIPEAGEDCGEGERGAVDVERENDGSDPCAHGES